MDKIVQRHVNAEDAPFLNYSFVVRDSRSNLELTTCPRYKSEVTLQVAGSSITLTLQQAKELEALIGPAIKIVEEGAVHD